MDERIKKTMKALRDNNIGGYYAEDKNKLLELISEFIKVGSIIGSGDSVTLEQTGVFEYLRKADYVFLDKHKKGLSSEEKREIYLKNFSADTFITGTNAITMNGELFNIDGNGSRVAPMIYGPKQVIVVVGKNKITKDVKEAIYRTRQIAAPLDAKRLHKNTPCVKLGYCIDCKNLDRICNDFVLISRQFIKNRIKVIIVDEVLGY